MNRNELYNLSLTRLYVIRDMLMSEIKHCVMGYHIIDKNEFFKIYCELETCLQVIDKKIKFEGILCVR